MVLNLLGKSVKNFQFSGSSLQNLPFDDSPTVGRSLLISVCLCQRGRASLWIRGSLAARAAWLQGQNCQNRCATRIASYHQASAEVTEALRHATHSYSDARSGLIKCFELFGRDSNAIVTHGKDGLAFSGK